MHSDVHVALHCAVNQMRADLADDKPAAAFYLTSFTILASVRDQMCCVISSRGEKDKSDFLSLYATMTVVRVRWL